MQFSPHLGSVMDKQVTPEGSANFAVTLGIKADDAGSTYSAGYKDEFSGLEQGLLVKAGTNGYTQTYFADAPSGSGGQPDDQFLGVALDSAGATYVTDFSFNAGQFRVLKYDPDGSQAWAVSPPDAANFQYGKDVALDAQGNVYAMTGNADHTLVFKLPATQTQSSLSIKLSPGHVQPSKLDGATLSPASVIIRVMDSQGNPVPNQDVNLSAHAVQASGGHDGPDHGGNRPGGFFTGGTCTAQSPCPTITCTTNTNGDCLVAGQAPIYIASQFGGQETITAQSVRVPSVSTSATLTVAASPLQDFPAFSNLFPFNQWHLTGQVTSFIRCPNLSNHPSNHWVTPATQNRVIIALEEFYTASGIRVGVNDMSLQEGGLFDICGAWVRPHDCHRTGESVDIDKSTLSRTQKNLFSKFMGENGANIVPEGASLHYQFPGIEQQRSICHGDTIQITPNP